MITDNGIIVGAPAFQFEIQNRFQHAWLARSNRDNGLSTGNIVRYPAKAAVLHRALVKACWPARGRAASTQARSSAQPIR